MAETQPGDQSRPTPRRPQAGPPSAQRRLCFSHPDQPGGAPGDPEGRSRLWHVRFADENFGLERTLAGKTAPRPERFGVGRATPCRRTQLMYLVIAAREKPPPVRLGKLAPHALRAARKLPLAPPGPPAPGAPPPGPPAPDEPGGGPPPGVPPPGGLPAAGRVTPCLRRQATSVVRRAPPAPAALEEVLLVELLPPHAARFVPATTATSARRATLRRGAWLRGMKVTSGPFVVMAVSRRSGFRTASSIPIRVRSMYCRLTRWAPNRRCRWSSPPCH